MRCSASPPPVFRTYEKSVSKLLRLAISTLLLLATWSTVGEVLKKRIVRQSAQAPRLALIRGAPLPLHRWPRWCGAGLHRTRTPHCRGCMSIESDEFRMDEIEWHQIQSRERRPDGLAPMPTRGGVRRALVTCKSCSHTWRASTHGGGLTAVFGRGVIVVCPLCSASATVRAPGAT